MFSLFPDNRSPSRCPCNTNILKYALTYTHIHIEIPYVCVLYVYIYMHVNINTHTFIEKFYLS
jgi:hypothetical protein